MFEDDSELNTWDTWEGFAWGELTAERSGLLDAVYMALAQWVCDSQAAARAPGDHGSARCVGLPCEECEALAISLLAGSLGELLSYFGHAAYHAGRDGIRCEDAAIRVLRAVGQPIEDRLGAEQLLRDIHHLPPGNVNDRT